MFFYENVFLRWYANYTQSFSSFYCQILPSSNILKCCKKDMISGERANYWQYLSVLASLPTKWTNVNLLYFPGSIEINEGLTLCCQKLGNLSKLTRRPRGGGHIQISVQLRVINVRGRLNSLGLESF